MLDKLPNSTFNTIISLFGIAPSDPSVAGRSGVVGCWVKFVFLIMPALLGVLLASTSANADSCVGDWLESCRLVHNKGVNFCVNMYPDDYAERSNCLNNSDFQAATNNCISQSRFIHWDKRLGRCVL
jgi:hypothetical protein